MTAPSPGGVQPMGPHSGTYAPPSIYPCSQMLGNLGLDGGLTRADYRQEVNALFERATRAEAAHTKVLGENDRLRRALESYAEHRPWCGFMKDTRKCNCGYTEALRGAAGDNQTKEANK